MKTIARGITIIVLCIGCYNLGWSRGHEYGIKDALDVIRPKLSELVKLARDKGILPQARPRKIYTGL